jgi:hypothetical protein
MKQNSKSPVGTEVQQSDEAEAMHVKPKLNKTNVSGSTYHNNNTNNDKKEKIKTLKKSLIDLKDLKKAYKISNNSKMLKKSNIAEWAKECFDNSIKIESKIKELDFYIQKVKNKIDELNSELLSK